MNIYEFDFGHATDWVIAETKQDAIKEHAGVTGCELCEYDRFKVRRLKKSEYDLKTYFCEELDIPQDNPITFRKFMEEFMPNEAQFFCSTEY